jgi:ABC-type branched-subunit amino acid transport system ATPase component
MNSTARHADRVDRRARQRPCSSSNTNLELIARISRSVTVLDRGRVLAAGTPDEVFRHPDVERAYMGREGGRPR